MLCCILFVAVFGSIAPFSVLASCVSSMPSSGDGRRSGDPGDCPAACSERKKKKEAAKQQQDRNRNTLSATTKPVNSFYQRKLPKTCVAFASTEGKKIFKSALVDNGLKSFYNLIEQHHTQTEPAFCGVSTRTCYVMLCSVLKRMALNLEIDAIPCNAMQCHALLKSGLASLFFRSIWRTLTKLAVLDSFISCFLVPPVVLVLNALAVDPGQNWKGPWRWYEESMLNCCVDMEEIKQTGITLQDFQCLAFCQGLSVELHYCDDETSSLEGFRKAVERACLEEPFENNENENDDDDGRKILECLVVSYSRKVLNQTGDGHFSPLAAYDKESDSVLILDTARFKYGAHWTKLPLIYEAMKPIDNATGKSRGYALLSFVSKEAPPSKEAATSAPTTASEAVGEEAPSETSSGTTTLINTSNKLSTQPASILYRSMMNQKQKRKRYKEYIKSLREANDRYANGEDIPYEVVRSYWYEGGDRPSAVWEIIVPTRVRIEEEIEMLRKMRFLLVDLHHATIEKGNDTSNEIPTKRSRMGDDCEAYGNQNTTTPTSGSSNSKRNNSWCRTCETYNPTTNHTVSMSAEETLYIIYLATLSEERRHDFVMNFDSPETTDVVRKQIIKEADMIASAIEVSDQLTSL